MNLRCLVLLTLGSFAHANEALTLWYDKPAKAWTEALPLGNGRLGAMIFGGPTEARYQLNEDTLWGGGPTDPSNSGALQSLPEVQQLIFAGKYAEAEKRIAETMMGTPPTQSPYQTVGNLRLQFSGGGPVTQYRRQLDLDSATTTTRFQQGGVTFTREAFISAVDQVLAIRLTADRPRSISFTASFDSPMGVEVRSESPRTLVMHGHGGKGGGLDHGALSFECRAKISTTGGTTTSNAQHISVEQADSVLIFLDADTSFRRYDDVSGDPSLEPVAHLAAAEKKGWDTLLRDHLSEHRQYFRRVSLDLGSSPAAEKPTDQRLQNFAKGSNDPSLIALYYQWGRYLLLGSSRPGTQPANLQGIWNDQTSPPWQSKYTVNINTEMNYWPAETANLSELTEPLIRLVKEIAETGKRTAQIHYGARGWVCHHNTDLWRNTQPIDGPQWGMWPTGGAWLCTHLWEHYQFTGDRDFLSDIYPVLKGACEFFLDTLVTDPQHGWLVTNPSISPENRHPYGASVCAGPSMDMSLLRDLFSQTAEAANILHSDDDFRQEILTVREKLAPLQIGEKGQLQEWMDDWDSKAPDQNHRHISHLYALFPSNQIDLRKTPDLAQAAARSLDTRGDFSTGWAIGWRINCRARLHDGDRTLKILHALLDPSRTYPNLFDAHPPFQIDGNFGGTAGITEMLLQSHNEEIELLPALPAAWTTGKVTGLCARGGFTVDITWNDGLATEVTLHSRLGQPCTVRIGDRKLHPTIERGKSLTLALTESD